MLLTFQNEFVVEQPLRRLQQERVERQVAHLLRLEVFEQRLEALVAPRRGLQFRHDLLVVRNVVPVQLCVEMNNAG